MSDLWTLKHTIENARDWLRDALHVACAGEGCEGWPALAETADRTATALAAVEALLPLHPEIEAAIQAELDDDRERIAPGDRGDDERSGP
jgi:hypothetical protein